MSEPKRYFLKISQTISGLRCDTYEDKDGMYVDYEDYASLKAEVERLTHEVKYWRIEAQTDHERWLRCLQELEQYRKP